jgi:hypothetical protein
MWFVVAVRGTHPTRGLLHTLRGVLSKGKDISIVCVKYSIIYCLEKFVTS